MVQEEALRSSVVRNLDVYEHEMPMPGKVMVVLDMRSQIGGKSVIWETAVNEGCIYVEMSPDLNGLAVLMFVQYLKKKGILVLILLSGASGPGSPAYDGLALCTSHSGSGEVCEE